MSILGILKIMAIIYAVSIPVCWLLTTWVRSQCSDYFDEKMQGRDPKRVILFVSCFPIGNTFLALYTIWLIISELFAKDEQEEEQPNRVTKDDLRP